MKDSIREEVARFVAGYPGRVGTQTRWDEPLVQFARADDTGFDEIRVAVGDHHLRPREIMPDAIAVMALFVPYHEELARLNRPGFYAAREWALAFSETRQMLWDLGDHLASWLRERGHRLVGIPEEHGFHEMTLRATWSHKHVAVIAGLGRPGLHTMLITEKGCFGRVWSYLTDLDVAGDPRMSYEPCLELAGKPCGICVRRCVGEALHMDHYDKEKCYEQCLRNEGRYPELPVTDICGKCQVGGPCERTSPVKG